MKVNISNNAREVPIIKKKVATVDDGKDVVRSSPSIARMGVAPTRRCKLCSYQCSLDFSNRSICNKKTPGNNSFELWDLQMGQSQASGSS